MCILKESLKKSGLAYLSGSQESYHRELRHRFLKDRFYMAV